MTRRDLVWSAAFGAAFAARMELHGTPVTRIVDGSPTAEVHDARPEAERWARMIADAAVERSGAR